MATSSQYQGAPPEWADTNSHAILEASPDAMLVVNRAGEIVAANLQAQKLFRLRRDELLGIVVESLLPVRFRERHRQHRENFLANPEAQFIQVPDIFALRSDASELPVDVSLSRLTIGSETFAISAIRDASERVRIEELKRSEAMLRESEERFRSLADTAPVLIWQSGKDKLYTYFNKPWLDFTGRSMEEELGNGWAEGVHPEDLQRCLDTYTQSFDRREKFRMEYRLRRHDGEYRWIIDIGVPRFNQDRSFAGYIGIGVDVTERKRAEEAQRESEERLRLALQAGKVYAYEWDVATDAVVRSEEFRSILGSGESGSLTRQQLSAKVHPDDRARFVAAVDNLTRQNPTTQLTYRVFRADGSMVWVEKHGHAFFDPQGRVLRMIGMVTDVTERKRSEERLREYEKAVEAVEEMIAVVDREYRILMANRKYAIVQDMAKGQVVGRFVHEVLNKGVFDRVVKPKLDECFQGRVVRYEMKYTYPALGERDVAVSYFPIEGTTGVEGAACILQDITDRKRAEEALRESEARLHLAIQAGKMYAYEWDVATDVLVRSTEYVNVLGATEPRTLTHQQVLERIHPEDRPKLVAAVARHSLENPTVDVTYRVLLPGKSQVWVKSSGRAVFDGNGKMSRVVGIVADITDQKLAEEALHTSEERLRLAQQAARIGTFEWNIRTGVNTWTPELETMYGLPPGGFGGTQKAFENLVHPDDLAGVIELVDGSLTTGQPANGEWRAIWPDGSVHWIAGRWQVLMDDSGQPSRVVGVNMDVTERKHAEQSLADMTRTLIESQEQERSRIGRELHDDINQRLAMLALELEQPHDPSEFQNRVQRFREELRQISDDVQALSHDLHSTKLEYLGVVAGMKSWCKEFTERQKMDVDFKSDVRSVLPLHIGRPLFRVLQEALNNAFKHSGVKRIEVQLREDSGEIHLIVRDLGRGFDVEAALHGKGLGLTSMRERVRLVNGTIVIDSKPMGGTTIHVRVPLGSAQAPAKTA